MRKGCITFHWQVWSFLHASTSMGSWEQTGSRRTMSLSVITSSFIEPKPKFQSHSQVKISVFPNIPWFATLNIGLSHGQESSAANEKCMSGCILLTSTGSPDLGQKRGEEEEERETSFPSADVNVLCLPRLLLPVSRGFHTLVFGQLPVDYLEAPWGPTHCAAPDIHVSDTQSSWYLALLHSQLL